MPTPRLSQLETPPMSDESLIPCPSDSVPESPQNAPASDACQPVIISDVHSESQQANPSPQECVLEEEVRAPRAAVTACYLPKHFLALALTRMTNYLNFIGTD